MVETLEALNEAIAAVLKDVLTTGGSALEVNSGESESISFCRIDGSSTALDQSTCGILKSAFFNFSLKGNQSDIVIRV